MTCSAETDQQYTNGIRASFISPNLDSYENDPALPEWVRNTNRRLKALHNDKSLQRNLVISLGQLIFTPEDIDATDLIEDDRPYAGYLHLSFGYHMRSDKKLHSTELSLGVVGPASLAEQAQDLIHDLRGFDKFQGWDNQLDNELILNLVHERKRKFSLPNIRTLQQDVIGHAGFAMGNLATYLNAGGEYRIGWQLPDDFGTSSLRAGGDTSAPGNFDRRNKGEGFHGIHAFIAVDARLVGRDIFLDGNTFEDSHSVDKEPLIADIAVGISTTINRWKISYAQVARTKEFRGQPNSHKYGSLSFSYTW